MPSTATEKLTDIAGNPRGNSSVVIVTVDTVPQLASFPTDALPISNGGINASEASNGTPVVVDLTGTGAKLGDTLTIHWGGQDFAYVLTANDISSNKIARAHA